MNEQKYCSWYLHTSEALWILLNRSMSNGSKFSGYFNISEAKTFLPKTFFETHGHLRSYQLEVCEVWFFIVLFLKFKGRCKMWILKREKCVYNTPWSVTVFLLTITFLTKYALCSQMKEYAILWEYMNIWLIIIREFTKCLKSVTLLINVW